MVEHVLVIVNSRSGTIALIIQQSPNEVYDHEH